MQRASVAHRWLLFTGLYRICDMGLLPLTTASGALLYACSALTLSDNKSPARLAPAIRDLAPQVLIAGHVHDDDTWQGAIG